MIVFPCAFLGPPSLAFLGPPGPSWDLLDPPGPSWALRGLPGPSWTLLAPPGASWVLLGPSWVRKNSAWVFLVTRGDPEHFGSDLRQQALWGTILGSDLGGNPVFYEGFWIWLRRGLDLGWGTPVFYEGFWIWLRRGLNPWGDDPSVLRGFLDLIVARA